ncbi:hypothetical protein C8F01DRAFT_1161753, partial [Mycena amicta]
TSSTPRSSFPPRKSAAHPVGLSGLRMSRAGSGLTFVAALPTSEAELQLGLAKVVEPDSHAFLAYAAIV